MLLAVGWGGMEWDGVEWNGMGWNGINSDGMRDGSEQNGPRCRLAVCGYDMSMSSLLPPTRE